MVRDSGHSDWAFAKDSIVLIAVVIALTLATGGISMNGCGRSTVRQASAASGAASQPWSTMLYHTA